jgi:hypothetical protein
MGFLQSPEQIYRAMTFGGQVARWASEDWFTIFHNLSQQGFIWDPEDGKLRIKGQLQLTNNTPWCHTRSSADKRCTFDHNIIFNNWRILTPRCLECWKVVVAPRNFDELIKLEKLQLTMDVDCKCGIELRDYTPRHYGGYFYNSSLDAGRKRYLEVKDAVSEAVSPECGATTILKRGCTEYEMVAGPSNRWHINKTQEKFLEQIEAYVDVRQSLHEQGTQLKRNIRMKWVLWAHSNGDMSYVPYNGGNKLYPGYVAYHEGDIEDVKHDLALSKAEAAAKIPYETSEKFLIGLSNFAEEFGVANPSDLIYTMGGNHYSPLNMGKMLIKNIPDEVKGDLDETT